VRLHWTSLATAHLRAAYQYVANDNAVAAHALIERIFVAADMLETYPNLGRTGRVQGTRELVVAGTPFVLVYRVAPKSIELLAVFHSARRWPEEF
jgi:toxin ParE1/3/4